MANTPRRIAVIGLDCAEPHLIEKHIADGHLPTLKKLIQNGVIADNCMVPYPTITPPNWASIATGAWPGTHGITDFHVHIPGTTPDAANCVQAFSSERLKAETLWDAADRAGKKCIVFNYPGSWPSKMKNGIVVGGRGLSIGETRDGLPGMFSKVNFCNDMLITTGFYPLSIKGEFVEAKGWKNLPEAELEPLELEAKMNFRDAETPPAPTSWYVLAHQSGDKGYDQITFGPAKNMDDAFCTLSVGEWSPVIRTKMEMNDGKTEAVFFRCKLVELSSEADDFRLYISSICTETGWSDPPEVAALLKSDDGISGCAAGIIGYGLEWFGLDTFIEVNELYTRLLADYAHTLLTTYEWDLFFMHAHSPDWGYHMILSEMDPQITKDKATNEAAWDAHLRIYQAQDRMVGQLLTAMDKDTLVILVSDHGAVADGPAFNPYHILEPAGLAVLAKDQLSFDIGIPTSSARGVGLVEEIKIAFQIPDRSKCKCFPQRTIYIYINLKGRDPDGIVEPADYEKVQQEIIDAMYSYVDPKTGKRPVSLALTKKDARILGLYGDHIGDVVYALYPWFSGQHGNILPAAEWGVGSLKALLTFTGPGIKKRFRLERPTNLVDIVPTVCYLMDLPLPAQAEGAVIYQAFKNPDFKSEEINKLKAGLARMETALQRGERQPWDKHECA